MDVLEEYWKARRDFIQAEVLTKKYVQPVANELRNGLDDVARAIAGLTPPGNGDAMLDDALRHFRRARSEAYEAILLFYLATIADVLLSLRADPRARVIQAKYYQALDEAHNRGYVALVKAKDTKTDQPEAARAECKEAIGIVVEAMRAFMKCEGEFVMAHEIRTISTQVSQGSESSARWNLWQLAIALGGYILSVLLFIWSRSG
ncbi:MAG: hypothetical protein IT432_14990 [Phycisphaerales bacterium]|nr:hypothetical protein [Phycisphaerales bacterium]